MVYLVSPAAEGEAERLRANSLPSAAGETITRIAEIALSKNNPTAMSDEPFSN